MGCCESRFKQETKNDNLNQTRPINLNYISTKMNELHEPKPNMQIKEKSLYKSTQDKSQISNNLIYYRGLRIKKKLNNCVDSMVYLCEYNIIKKIYPNNSEGIGNFRNEIGVYERISHLHFIPKLLCVDYSNYTFYIPYYRFKPEKTPRNRLIIDQYLRKIEKYGIQRLHKICWNNIVSDGNQLYLIDFGSVPIYYVTKGKVKWKLTNLFDYNK